MCVKIFVLFADYMLLPILFRVTSQISTWTLMSDFVRGLQDHPIILKICNLILQRYHLEQNHSIL